MKKILTSRLTLAIMLLVMSIFNLFSIGERVHLRRQLKTQQPKIIIHKVDNAGGSIVGKVRTLDAMFPMLPLSALWPMFRASSRAVLAAEASTDGQ